MRQSPFMFESEEAEDGSQFEDSFELFENENEYYEGEAEDGETEFEAEVRRGRSRRAPVRQSPYGRARTPRRPRPRPPKPRYPSAYPPAFSSPGSLTAFSYAPPDNPELVRVLQSLLNKVLNLNLPVDGVMTVETRSAIRSFQNQPDASGGERSAAEDAAGSAAPGAPDDKAAPQEEYDGFGFENFETDSFEFEDEDQWNAEYFERELSGGTSIAAGSIRSLRENMVRIAQQEWLRWGKGAIRESDPKMRAVLRDYWKTGTGRARPEANWWSAVPWSAAFISWVVKKAGGGGAFKYSAAHAGYIKAAKDNRLANNGNPFRAYRIHEIAPQPGDLVCACRDTCRANYDTVAAGMPTHCDIVTEKHPGYLVTIGGNVNNTVGRKTVPVDGRGFIKASNPKTSKYFTVIRAERRSAVPAYAPNAPKASAPKASAPGAPDIVAVRGIRIARQIAPQIDALLAAAERDGVKLSGGGYRSSEQQIKLRIAHCGGNTPYNIYEKPSSQCTPPTAPPGRSNHEKGLAIDFTYNGQGIKSRTNPGFVWLAKNASKYGLYNLPSEPWHWSVNGK